MTPNVNDYLMMKNKWHLYKRSKPEKLYEILIRMKSEYLS